MAVEHDEFDAPDVSTLVAENRRLREMVGPIEQSYSDLRAELDEARDAVKAAEAANGVLRNDKLELQYSLDRLHHNLGDLKRLAFVRTVGLVDLATRPARRYWNDRKL